jgi:hypothetical protein
MVAPVLSIEATIENTFGRQDANAVPGKRRFDRVGLVIVADANARVRSAEVQDHRILR